MNKQDFTTTFSVDQTPQEAFGAINNVHGWWSEDVEGNTDKLGDEFTFRNKDVHRSKQKLWLVPNDHLNFAEDNTEWKDTKVVFEIFRKGNKTQIRFIHRSLVPDYECFDVRSSACSCYTTAAYGT